MIFHSEFKMIPKRQGGSSGGVYDEDTLSMLTRQPTQVGLEYGMESAYDDDSRLTGITTTNGGTTLDSTTYTLDGVGNRLTKAQPQQSITVAYTYDDIYRLTQATPTGGSYPAEAYTYDNVGNRLTKTNEQAPDVNETTTYTYDDENRLTQVEITDGSGRCRTCAFKYDPFGRRIKKTVSPSGGGVGEETNYLYDNQNIILEYNTSNEVQTRYTHGPNIDEPLAVEIKGATTFTLYYYHADGLGNITALTDTNGDIVQRYEYDSFGNQTITVNGNIAQPYTYTAREYDTETTMYFYRARYYDQKAGRFVTKDPIGFDSGDVNVYGYVGSNPINRNDPNGLTWLGSNWCGPGGSGPTTGCYDTACKRHDKCYEKCGFDAKTRWYPKNILSGCVAKCDAALAEEWKNCACSNHGAGGSW